MRQEGQEEQEEQAGVRVVVRVFSGLFGGRSRVRRRSL